MTWNYDNPLAIAEALGETPKAHAALLLYWEMGPDRTYAKVHERYGAKPSYLRYIQRWASVYEWQARIARAQELETLARQEAERAIWLERRRETAERGYALAQQLFDRAQEMLAWPISADQVKRERQVIRDGERVIEQTILRQPAKWQPRDAAAFVKTGNEVARLAAGLDDKPQVNLNVTPDEIARMSDEELAALLDRLKQ